MYGTFINEYYTHLIFDLLVKLDSGTVYINTVRDRTAQLL